MEREINEVNRSPALESRYLSEFVAYIDRGPKTARTYLTDLKQFAAWLDFNGIRQPVRADIIDYRKYLAEEHQALTWTPDGARIRTDAAGDPVRITCRSTTTAQYLHTVKRFFEWTEAAGLYPNIAKGINAPKVRQDAHRREALTVDEVRAVEQAIRSPRTRASNPGGDPAGKETERTREQEARLYAMFLLAVNCGLRTVEISRANVKDLEERNGRTWLYITGKGHTDADQKKPLADEVAEAVRDYVAARADGAPAGSPLFVATGNRSGGKRIASTTISTMLKGAIRAGGIYSDRITAHSLRHTAGTQVQRITGDLYQTQKYLRHANPKTTEIYLHTNDEEDDARIAQELFRSYHADI